MLVADQPIFLGKDNDQALIDNSREFGLLLVIKWDAMALFSSVRTWFPKPSTRESVTKVMCCCHVPSSI